MARLARSVFPGVPHHLAQQGRDDRTIFQGEPDYRRYLEWLRQYSARYGVEIWAYCLMPDSVDFVCVPSRERSLALAFNSLHMRYAQLVNARSATSGPLWRSRFMSCPLDGPAAREDVRFVETIPVRAGLVVRAEDYSWSSAWARVRGEADSVTDADCRLVDEIRDWRAFLSESPADDIVLQIRERLKTGRPAGNADFVRKLEETAGRRLDARPRGRPRKAGPGNSRAVKRTP
ncbi:MAG: transposase [Acidobacteriota bacterium]